jgi:hypothetical protein
MGSVKMDFRKICIVKVRATKLCPMQNGSTEIVVECPRQNGSPEI